MDVVVCHEESSQVHDAGLWKRYKVTLFNKLSSCYNKCLKMFFGYRRRDSVTQILFNLGIPSFSTVVHNSKVLAHSAWCNCPKYHCQASWLNITCSQLKQLICILCWFVFCVCMLVFLFLYFCMCVSVFLLVCVSVCLWALLPAINLLIDWLSTVCKFVDY